jgi:hypothetical protein
MRWIEVSLRMIRQEEYLLHKPHKNIIEMTINLILQTTGLVITIIAWFVIMFKWDQVSASRQTIFDQIVIDAEKGFFNLKNFIQTAVIAQLLIFLIQ